MYAIGLRELIENVASQDLIVGAFLTGAGLVFMLLGGRIFRALTAISFGVLGFMVGATLPVSGPMQLVVGIAGAVGLGVISMWAVKVSVGVLAGGWAGWLMLQACMQLEINEQVSWALAFCTFAAALSLAFIVFPEVVAFVTSLEGAIMCIGGLIIFFSQSPVLWSHIKGLLLSSPVFGPFLLIAGTVTGFCLQMTEQMHKDTGGRMV